MSSKAIRLKPWEENDREYIAVDFRFDIEIIAPLLELGAELSPLSGHWLLPASLGNLRLILDKFGYPHTVLNCGVLPFNRERAMENKVKPKALTLKQISKVLLACRSTKERCLLSLMYSSGLRFAEVARIKLNDINFYRGSITIRADRGRQTRETILCQTSIPILNAYIDSYRPGEWLFEGAVNGHQSIRGLKQILKSAMQRAGISAEAHGLLLRNSLISHLMLQGTEPEIVCLMLNGAFAGEPVINDESVYNTG